MKLSRHARGVHLLIRRLLKEEGGGVTRHERSTGAKPIVPRQSHLSSSISAPPSVRAEFSVFPRSFPRAGLSPASPGAWTLQQIRGVKISGSDVKVGFVIERKGRIERVLKTQHTTQGRGGALIQVEVRDVQTGLKSSARLRTSEAIEKVFVDERVFTFLYSESETVHVMDPDTFEQMEVPAAHFDTGTAYLTDGMEVTLEFFDGKPLSAAVPSRVSCRVAEAEPYFKGQTATPSYKKVVLENGRQILNPSFVSAGDVIVVDTTIDSYVTRAKS